MSLKVEGDPSYGSIGDRTSAGSTQSSSAGSETVPLLIPGAMWNSRLRLVPMDKNELLLVVGTPGWRRLHSLLGTLFWVGWLAAVGIVIGIIAQNPAPVVPRLRWWQRVLFCRLQAALFLDSGRMGAGAINEVRDHLPHLRGLGVGALILEGLLPRGLPAPGIMKLNQSMGTLSQFQQLLAEGQKADMRILLDLCDLDLRDSSNLNSSDQTEEDTHPELPGLRFWLEQGVAGFSICDRDAAFSVHVGLQARAADRHASVANTRNFSGSEIKFALNVHMQYEGLFCAVQDVHVFSPHQTLLLWRGLMQNLSQERNEKILVVSKAEETDLWYNMSDPLDNHSLVDMITRSFLPSLPRPSSTQEVAVAIATRLLRPQREWPSWTVRVAMPGELQKTLMVLLMTLPGTPVISYGINVSPSQVRRKPGRTDSALFHSLSQLRSREEALLLGNLTFLSLSNSSHAVAGSVPPPPRPVLAFLCSWSCRRILVLLNLGPDIQGLDPGWARSLPAAGVFLLSTGLGRLGSVALETLQLQPWEAVVIKL